MHLAPSRWCKSHRDPRCNLHPPALLTRPTAACLSVSRSGGGLGQPAQEPSAADAGQPGEARFRAVPGSVRVPVLPQVGQAGVGADDQRKGTPRVAPIRPDRPQRHGQEEQRPEEQVEVQKVRSRSMRAASRQARGVSVPYQRLSLRCFRYSLSDFSYERWQQPRRCQVFYTRGTRRQRAEDRARPQAVLRGQHAPRPRTPSCGAQDCEPRCVELRKFFPQLLWGSFRIRVSLHNQKLIAIKPPCAARP
jgi:hypothetical protein